MAEGYTPDLNAAHHTFQTFVAGIPKTAKISASSSLAILGF